MNSWTLLDSHDTARFRTVTGSRERHVVGIGLQMTTPGVPMVFAGDELGVEGAWGEDARRPMPWGSDVLEEYVELAGLRRSSDALARGGIRYAHVSRDAIAYLRERLLCLAARAAHEPVRVALDARELEPLYGSAQVRADDGVVELPGDGPAFHVWRVV
jgi:alpha-glucosidase